MNKKTYYHLILDKSGSMSDCIHPTISGYNEQLQLLRSLQERYPDQAIRVGLTQFNHEVEHTFSNQDPQHVRELTQQVYHPGGTTALYDAFGSSVRLLQEQVGEELQAGIATVVVVILTDGYENASRQYSLPAIQSLIRELEASGRWTFSYLGATLDAVEVASRMNIKTQNSRAFDKGNMHNVYVDVSNSMISYMEKKARGKDLGDFLQNEND